jgi:tetratricopeptide (TPR) repeat protein
LLACVSIPAAASTPGEANRLADYVAARAADSLGNPGEAAILLSQLIRERPDDVRLRERAVAQAIEAGDMKLALQLGKSTPFSQAPLEFRMLLLAEDLRRGKLREALASLRNQTGTIDSTFLVPFVEAWVRADRGDRNATQSLDAVGEQSSLGKQVDEHRALILLKLKRPAEALPLAEKALANAGGRADRLRLAFADGFRGAGDMASAARILEGAGPALSYARERLASRKPLGQTIASPADAFGELMLGLAIALNRLEDKSLSVALAQTARYANPRNGAAVLLLGLLLDDAGRTGDAIAVLRSIPADDPFASQGADAEMRVLLAADRAREALVRAQQAVVTNPGADAYSRLGAVQGDLKDYSGAADSYARAIAASRQAGGSDELWMLHLYRAGVLEDADRWAEAKSEISAAMALAPDNALLLNFLGYGKLERGEDLDEAEAMIRRASAMRPDDASITDSLGWAEYKRGKVDEAIVTLQRAADRDPNQSEIREHLGDALYSAGRRIEARFAWRAALVGTEDKVTRSRIESKMAIGLTPANAAP